MGAENLAMLMLLIPEPHLENYWYGSEVPNLSAAGTDFVENSFSMDQKWGVGMIRAHYTYCALCF